MESLIRKTSKTMCAVLLVLVSACNVETGDKPGEENREDPKMEKQDETSDGFTREGKDGTADAEENPVQANDTTNTDSTHVTPRMQRSQ